MDGFEEHGRSERRGGDFNYDFSVSITEAQQRAGDVEYNYRREEPAKEEAGSGTPSDAIPGPVAAMVGTDEATYTRERPGMSAFVLENGTV